ncbi:hypothetical protein D9M70_407110 [compost metagenome]
MDLEAFGAKEIGVVDHGTVERQHRGHALDPELAQRAARTRQRLLARGAGHDQLGHQRVEGAGHHRAGLHARIDAHTRARRGLEALHRARRGQEAAAHVLGVDAELD